jgi:hypothetical protein
MPFITRLPALTGADPYPDALLALDFVGARRGPQYYKSGGVTVSDITQIPGWTYTGGTPAGIGSYAPRLDGSLQFFPSVTNSILQSQTFDNVAWTKTDVTISADVIVAPNGTLTADLVTAGSALTDSVNSTAATIGSGSTNTISIYFKKSGTQWLRLIFADGTATNGFNQWVDLTNGVLGTSTIRASGTKVGATIENSGNGWYRVTLTGIVSTQTTLGLYIASASGDGNATRVSGATYYAWGAQLELGSTASTYIPTTTAAVTVAPPRITDAGYLPEEARTNSIRNNTMVGAVAGTPGTAPTNWQVTANGNGLSTQIVATGTDSVTGAPYAEVRFFGTTSSAVAAQIKFEATNGIAATNAQAWTASVYAALVAGSVSGFSAGPVLQFDMNNSVPTYVGNSSNVAVAATSTMTRGTLTFTTNQATTAYVTPYISITPGSGKAVDFTLRVSLPQMELGSFATSPIPTTSVAVTRAADVGYISGLTVPTTGTMLATANVPATAVDQFLGYASDGTLSNRIFVNVSGSGGQGRGGIFASNVGNTIAGATVMAGAVGSVAMAYAPGAQSVAANGGTVATTTIATVPSVTRFDVGGGGAAVSTRQANGPIRRVVIYPRAMSNAELQAITTAGAY